MDLIEAVIKWYGKFPTKKREISHIEIFFLVAPIFDKEC